MNDLGIKSDRLTDKFEWVPGSNINVEGDEKTGKNHFSFTAPGPIVCISGDRKIDHLVAKFRPKKIYAARFHYDIKLGMDSEAVKGLVRPIWKEIEQLFWDALENRKVKSIVVDNGTWLWQTKRLASFGKTEKVPPVLYNVANAQFERMLLAGEEKPGKHVIWIHRLGEEWVWKKNDQGQDVSMPTGKRKREGFKHVGFDLQASLRCLQADGVFKVRVVDNAFDPSANGQFFKGKQLNYPFVMASLTGTEPEVWK